MARRELDAVVWVRKAPTITFNRDEGVFSICHNVGNAHIEFVMRPKVFAAAMLGAEEARAQWQYRTMDRGNVRKIKP